MIPGRIAGGHLGEARIDQAADSPRIAGREYLDTIHAREVLLYQPPFRWHLHAELLDDH